LILHYPAVFGHITAGFDADWKGKGSLCRPAPAPPPSSRSSCTDPPRFMVWCVWEASRLALTPAVNPQVQVDPSLSVAGRLCRKRVISLPNFSHRHRQFETAYRSQSSCKFFSRRVRGLPVFSSSVLVLPADILEAIQASEGLVGSIHIDEVKYILKSPLTHC
jgi:hypothetical protein